LFILLFFLYHLTKHGWGYHHHKKRKETIPELSIPSLRAVLFFKRPAHSARYRNKMKGGSLIFLNKMFLKTFFKNKRCTANSQNFGESAKNLAPNLYRRAGHVLINPTYNNTLFYYLAAGRRITKRSKTLAIFCWSGTRLWMDAFNPCVCALASYLDTGMVRSSRTFGLFCIWRKFLFLFFSRGRRKEEKKSRQPPNGVTELL
jgi:hypothetical protein